MKSARTPIKELNKLPKSESKEHKYKEDLNADICISQEDEFPVLPLENKEDNDAYKSYLESVASTSQNNLVSDHRGIACDKKKTL
ncbi:hypothetical protein NPIL_29561 [Nephila pilipes]|uniref:Uncharacterized protein n=1 Tax=Nephila pilipes TaxID=299642 RepID=A0A8X6UIP9_NEPPI|nr:hypothetical protein NPIL_29561 [Nephila pilipes]